MNGIIGDDISNGYDLDALPRGNGNEVKAGPVVSAPPDALIAYYGWLARALIVVPSLDVVVVSMGQTVGQSQTLGSATTMRVTALLVRCCGTLFRMRCSPALLTATTCHHQCHHQCQCQCQCQPVRR